MTEFRMMECDHPMADTGSQLISQLTTADWRSTLAVSRDCAAVQPLELTQQGDRQVSDERITRMARDLALYMHPGEDDSGVFWAGRLGMCQSGVLSWLKDIRTQQDLDALKKEYKEQAGADLGRDLDAWLYYGWSHQKEAWHAHLDQHKLRI